MTNEEALSRMKVARALLAAWEVRASRQLRDGGPSAEKYLRALCLTLDGEEIPHEAVEALLAGKRP